MAEPDTIVDTTPVLITRPATPLGPPRTLSDQESRRPLLEIRTTDERAPHVIRSGLMVIVDQGEVLLDDGGGTVVVDYVDLDPLIQALTTARDQLGDAR